MNKDYHFFLIMTQNYENIMKKIFKSLKCYKRKESNYIIHLFVDSQRITYFQQCYNKLKTDTFKVEVSSAIPYKNLIKIKNPSWPYIPILKLLIPKLFPQLDKITCLDGDILIAKEGIQNLIDQNLDDYYINASIDVPIQYSKQTEQFLFEEKKQCQTTTYFNSGIIVLNLKKIREDKLDDQLALVTFNSSKTIEGKFIDQTFLNYILKNKVKICSPIYNNMLLATVDSNLDLVLDYIKKWNFKDVDDFINKTVIFHFCAIPKPWQKKERKDVYYFYKAKELWKEYKQRFEGKVNELYK